MALTYPPTPSIVRSATTSGEETTSSLRRWLGPFAVVLVLGVIGFGGYLVDARLDHLTAKPVTVGGNVRVVPLSGWHLVKQSHGKGPAEILLTRGGGYLQIVSGSFAGGSEELLSSFLRQFIQPQTTRFAVSRRLQQIQLDSGLTGIRATYVGSSSNGGPAIEGQVTAIVAPTGVGAVFNAWAPEGLFPYEAGDVDRMIVTAKVR